MKKNGPWPVIFLLPILALSCREKETEENRSINPKISEAEFSKISEGMKIAEVETILGKPSLYNPVPRAGGLAQALSTGKKEQSSLWCDDFRKCDVTIHCWFEDSILTKKRFERKKK